MDVWMYGRTDVHTDSPCILKDFVPSNSLRGRYSKRESERETETGDLSVHRTIRVVIPQWVETV